MITRKATISIIIAVYNGEKTLGTALESVKRQKYEDWECIIIDGKSKDNTVIIAKQYALEDNRFTIISEVDDGVFDAFNKGWERAEGEWIYYLGCDDELLANGLLAIANEIDDSCEIIYGGIVKKYRSGRKKESPAGYWADTMPFHLPCSHQGMIMKKDLIKSLGGFDLAFPLLADFDLINHAYYNGVKAKRTDELIAIFSLGGMSSDSIKSLGERYKILRKYNTPFIPTVIHTIYMTIFFILLKIKHRFD